MSEWPQVVLEEAGTRKVIFSTFDPDCATLLSLKQPRFPGEDPTPSFPGLMDEELTVAS